MDIAYGDYFEDYVCEIAHVLSSASTHLSVTKFKDLKIEVIKSLTEYEEYNKKIIEGN